MRQCGFPETGGAKQQGVVYRVNVLDKIGKVVAIVDKTLYIRQKANCTQEKSNSETLPGVS